MEQWKTLTWLALATSLAFWTPENPEINEIKKWPQEIAQLMLKYSQNTWKIHYDSEKNRITLKSETKRFEPFLVAGDSDELIAKLLNNAEYKRKFIQDLIKEIKKTESFKLLDDEDKKWFLSYLEEEVFPSFNKNEFENVLELDFSESDKKALLDKFPDIYAWIPKVSVQELENLSNLDMSKVVDEYIKTWELPKWFESFESDFKEIKAIIDEKKAIIRKWEEADRKGKKAKEIGDKIKWIIKEMKKMKKNSWIV